MNAVVLGDGGADNWQLCETLQAFPLIITVVGVAGGVFIPN